MKSDYLPSKIVLYGGTGQSKVVRPILESYGYSIEAIIDDAQDLKSPFEDVRIYQGFNEFKKLYNKDIKGLGFVVCIGNSKTHCGRIRTKLSRMLEDYKLIPVDAIDKSSNISENVKYGKGIQVMAGAIIMPLVDIGDYCIINTGASVDHECVLNEGVEIGPHATLCGEIYVGKNSWIGANATILPKLKIGENAIIGAGSVVTKDVSDNAIVVGNPAKEISKLK